MNDESDRRDTPTDIAPAPNGHDTLPPDPIDEADANRHLSTMLPAARTPETMKELAAEDLIDMHRRVDGWLAELMGKAGQKGRLELQTEAISATIDSAAAKWDGTYRLLAGEVQSLRQASEKKDREQDSKLEALAREIATLRGRVEALERERGGGRELSEVKSLLTALFLRLEMYETAATPPKATLTGRVILVVENEDLLVRTLKRVLTSRGAQVLTARNFEEVRVEVQRSDTDCVLLDIRLEADDGLEIAKWLIANGALPKERILLFTGHANDEHKAAAKSLGLVMLEKPVASTDLIAAIASSLETPLH